MEKGEAEEEELLWDQMSECRRRSRAAAGLQLTSDFSHKSLEAGEEGGVEPPAACLSVCLTV